MYFAVNQYFVGMHKAVASVATFVCPIRWILMIALGCKQSFPKMQLISKQ